MSTSNSTETTGSTSPTQASGTGVRARRSSMRERFSQIFKGGNFNLGKGKKDDDQQVADSITPDDFSRNNEGGEQQPVENESDDVRPSIVIDHGKRKAKDKDKKEKEKEKDGTVVVELKDSSRPSSPIEYDQGQKLIVTTPEGQGILVRSRPDGMVEIHLNSSGTTSPLPSPSVISKDLVTVPIEDDKEVSLTEFLVESRKYPNKYKLKSRRRSMDVVLDYHQKLSSAFDELEVNIREMQTNLRKYLRAKEKEVISLDDILQEAEKTQGKTGSPGGSPQRSPPASPGNSPRGLRQNLSNPTVSRALTTEERENLVVGLKQVVALSNSIMSSLQTSNPSSNILLRPRTGSTYLSPTLVSSPPLPSSSPSSSSSLTTSFSFNSSSTNSSLSSTTSSTSTTSS